MKRMNKHNIHEYSYTQVRQKPSIVRNCNVSGVVRKVINDVTSFASDVYSDVPEIVITSTPNNIVTPYISSYLHYVITELLKNSIVAHVTSERSETCLLYTSPSPRDQRGSRMPSSA